MLRTGLRVFRLLFLVSLLAALAVPVGVAADEEPPGAEASLVFVTQSDACDCVANLCVAGEQEVLNFLDAAGDQLRYERVDLTKTPDAGRTYRAVTLPVVLLFDGAGAEIARFDSFFTEAQLSGVWQQYLISLGARP